ncbi:MAG: conjugative transfer signal peptidase TraF [bacterium]|nr:conjugative transfer signal peptidase TraF [bacterium]
MTRSFWILCVGLVGAVGASGALGLRWNASSSVEPGLYLVERARPLERGDLVTVCLPEPVARWARGRGYLRRGRCPGDSKPVGKRIAGLEGDLVEVSGHAVAVNGRRLLGSIRVDSDARGRPVPLAPEGEFLLGAGEVWLHSGRLGRSLDSRIYGPLREQQIQSVLVPLWTSEED